MPEIKMPDINNVLLAGNLTNDPTFRKTSNGTSVINFHVASNRRYRDNSGIWRENVCYVGVVAWHKLAEACSEVLHKGSSVLIEGELQSRTWRTEDGNTRHVVEIRARRIQFLDRKETKDIVEASAADTASQADAEKEKIVPEAEAESKPEGDQQQTVEPTDFDFGYQDLKL